VAAVLSGAAAAPPPSKSIPLKYVRLADPPHPQPAKPHYRFARRGSSTLVSIFAGEKPTGGFEIQVTTAARRGTACVVGYRVEAPPEDAIVTQALTYPSAAVRLETPCRSVEVDPPLPLVKSR
jgi:hypothetical protein